MTDFSLNPLYHPSTEPDYAAIKPEHHQAVLQILVENRAALAELVQQDNPTWDSLMLPLAQMDNRLSLAFSPISHLHSVLSTDEWREAYEAVLPALSEYGADMAQHKPLYEAVKRLRDSAAFEQLSATQQKIIRDQIEGFERSGVGLPDAEKARFKSYSLRLSELSTQFSNHVLDATNAWHLLLPEGDVRLKGLPESALALMQALAAQHEQTGYRLTLDAPVVIPVLSYADERSLRETVYRAYNARASELTDNAQFDNAAIIAEILQIRQQMAELLGYADYASLSTADNKMAQYPAKVHDFLQDLVSKSKAAGEAEMQALREFAAQELGLNDLQAWDVGYAAEKLRQQRYELSQEDLRPYFPFSKVMQGMFAITEKLFGVRFAENRSLSVWYQDVSVYDVLNQAGQLQARFYLDPYAREKKRGGAWMDSAVSRFKDGENVQLPVAHLVCNFTPPVGGKDAYITHDEVTTLFHEFGHGLHHMLTQVDDYGASGISGVEWDAVEQPSQFMENFCYDRDCLTMMTAHQDTGEPLPEALFNKLLAAKNFQSAMAMLRQLEFALFDMRLHSQAEQGKAALDVLKAVRTQVSVTPEYPLNRFPMQFSHIFAGGYAAGYYSYKWAEVLSADSFAAFEETGILDAKTGAKFRDEILAVGSSRSSMDSFIAFRGREPQIDALLRHSGIAQ